MRLFRFNLDAVGMCASSLCMIHCLAFPFLWAALPMLKLSAEQTVGDAATQLATATLDAALPTNSQDDCCAQECCATGAAGDRSAVEVVNCCSTPTDFWIHAGLLVGVAPLGIIAWGGGYLKHGRLGVLFLGLSGVLLLCGALWFGHNLLERRGEQAMTAFWFFGIGAAIGSYLNVVAYRMPRGESIVFRRSRCPRCGEQIRGRDNVPIFGWLLLNGRCRNCRESISFRYPTVELIAGAIFLLLYFVELISGDANIPVRQPNYFHGVVWIIFFTKWDLVALYLFRGIALSSLLTWA